MNNGFKRIVCSLHVASSQPTDTLASSCLSIPMSSLASLPSQGTGSKEEDEEEGRLKVRRVIEGEDIQGAVKNKNEGWSSVWSSLPCCTNPDNDS